MKNTAFFILLTAIFLTGCSKQAEKKSIQTHPTVESVTVFHEGPLYYPRFSPDGRYIVCTSENHAGITLIDRADRSLRPLNEHRGAGAGFVFSGARHSIVFQMDTVNQRRRRVYSLIEQDLTTGEKKILAGPSRHLSQPLGLKDDILFYLENDTMQYRSLNGGRKIRTGQNMDFEFFYIRDHSIHHYSENGHSEWRPFGDARLIWPDVHPERSVVQVYVSGTGLYHCDWENRTTRFVGGWRAAVYSPDGRHIAYMLDRDDGQRITSSDIYIATPDSQYIVNVTDSPENIEMYPQWSPDGTNLVFHTLEGQIMTARLVYGRRE